MNDLAAIPEKRPNGCPPGEGVVVLPNGSRIGNPPHIPTDATRALVKRLCVTLPVGMIADVLQIATSTLYVHYRAELAEAKAEIVDEFGKSVIAKARNGDNDMLKFYLTRHGGWDETKRHEHTGAGGGPITHVDVARLTEAFRGMTPDERAIAERVLSLVASSGNSGGPDGSGGSPADIEISRGAGAP